MVKTNLESLSMGIPPADKISQKHIVGLYGSSLLIELEEAYLPKDPLGICCNRVRVCISLPLSCIPLAKYVILLRLLLLMFLLFSLNH